MWVVWGGREGGQGDQADWGDQCNDNQKEQERRGVKANLSLVLKKHPILSPQAFLKIEVKETYIVPHL